jgi:hypothetical protein
MARRAAADKTRGGPQKFPVSAIFKSKPTKTTGENTRRTQITATKSPNSTIYHPERIAVVKNPPTAAAAVVKNAPTAEAAAAASRKPGGGPRKIAWAAEPSKKNLGLI